jgi:hypothetical protein
VPVGKPIIVCEVAVYPIDAVLMPAKVAGLPSIKLADVSALMD